MTDRSLLAEALGTAWLVFGGCGSAVLAAAFPGLGIGFVGVSLAFGLTVLTMAYAIGPVSGCHLNPAVSIGLAVAGRFPANKLPGYIAAQLVGAIGGAGLLFVIASGKGTFDVSAGFASNGFGAHSPGGYSLVAGLTAEVVTTAFFLVVIVLATGRKAAAGFAPLAIGLCLTLIHLITIPVTNTSVNPARSTGPAIFAGGWALEQLWLFWVAPIVGAVAGGFIGKVLDGPGRALRRERRKPETTPPERAAECTPSPERERPAHADPSLWNPDLAPTTSAQRTWGKWHIAALWVGMAVCIPTYTLAAGLLASGMSWWLAVLTVLVGNVIVLVPMILNAHPGAKYGVPFPVLARASFGVRGANVPAILRALVACGWFGIQTWLGGQALYELVRALAPGIGEAPWLGDFFGINLAQLIAFLGFWAINMYFVVRGMESIKFFESWSAPVLIAVGLALLAWGLSEGGGPARVLEASEQFTRPAVVATLEGGQVSATLSPVTVDGAPKVNELRYVTVPAGADKDAVAAAVGAAKWQPYAPTVTFPGREGDRVVFEVRSAAKPAGSRAELKVPAEGVKPGGFSLGGLLVGLTAMVGFWATLSLNIPDFTRFARSQKDQLQGQAIGLPGTMALYSFIGVAVTSAALLAFPDVLLTSDAPWDPVALIARFDSPIVVVVAMFALAIATLTTNIAANVVSPANDFANLAPRLISFKTGGVITGVVGILIMPWKLLASVGDYLFVWLVGYSALLGPIGGIMIADYFIVRRRTLALDDLYRRDGAYAFGGSGVNWRAMVILALAVAPNVPGFLAAAGALDAASVPTIFHDLYTYAWFVGFGLGFGLYAAFGVPAKNRPGRAAASGAL